MSGGASSTSILRERNVDTVLGWLRSESSLTVRELQVRTGLSRPTLDSVVDDIIELGLATSSLDRTATGRPARRLRFRASAGHVAGVDIGRRSVRVVVTNLLGVDKAEEVRDLDGELNRAERLAAVVASVGECADRAGVTVSALTGVAVATPGTVVPQSGLVEMCEVIPEWSHFDLRGTLAAALGLEVARVAVENDAKLAGVAERWRGMAKGTEHAVVLMVGERPGAGIITNGELLQGHRGWAGELFVWDLWRRHYAHAPMPVAWAGAAIRRMADGANPSSLPQGSVSPTGSPEPGAASLSLEPTLQRMCAGDEQAFADFEIFANGAAWTIAAVASLLGPERIVLCGLPHAVTEDLVALWRRALAEMVPQVPTEILASTLHDRGVVIGAVHLALEVAQRQLKVNLL